MVVKPSLESGSHEALAYGIPFYAGTNHHYSSRKHSSETNAHLIEDDTCEDEEEHEHVKEYL